MAELYETQLVNQMGTVFESYNMNQIMGRICGLLISSVQSLSLDEIATKLQLSKPSISIQIRKLENMGYCRKLPKKSDRKDYYEISSDFIEDNYHNYLRTKEKNLKMFQRILHNFNSISNEHDIKEHRIVIERLNKMHRFAKLYIESGYKLLKEWETDVN